MVPVADHEPQVDQVSVYDHEYPVLQQLPKHIKYAEQVYLVKELHDPRLIRFGWC